MQLVAWPIATRPSGGPLEMDQRHYLPEQVFWLYFTLRLPRCPGIMQRHKSTAHIRKSETYTCFLGLAPAQTGAWLQKTSFGTKGRSSQLQNSQFRSNHLMSHQATARGKNDFHCRLHVRHILPLSACQTHAAEDPCTSTYGRLTLINRCCSANSWRPQIN